MMTTRRRFFAPAPALALAARDDQAEIRSTLRAFEDVRRSEAEADEADRLYALLGRLLCVRGFAAVIADGQFYKSTRIVPGQEDAWGASAFSARLILNLDA